jgi:selenide,water dikinase
MHIVLIGGGHAHVQVLESLIERPLAGARVSLVVDDPIAVYSGMVPGLVAGQYARAELEIDARPLAKRANAELIVAGRCGSMRRGGAFIWRTARRSSSTWRR